ncbi:MAG: hypothetical protein WAL41_06840 [Mycobacterium sp.]
MTTEATDIRFAVDTEQEPLCYPEWSGQVAKRLVVEVPGQHLLVTLVLPLVTAREWAGELFAGVTSAHRETTGDPHAMSDEEAAGFARARYDPPPGIHVSGDHDRPARIRFHVVLEVAGASLTAGNLRAAIVTSLTRDLNLAHVAVSAGEPLSGTVTS